MIESSTKSTTSYPNVAQSFGIVGIVILGMILLSPVNFFLSKVIGKEASMLIYYLLSIVFPFWIVYSIRKSKTNFGSFNYAIENKRIIPFIIIGTIALFLGVISPIVSLIPMPDVIKRILLDSVNETGIFTFLLMVIVAPVLEELIFRGLILDGLLKNYSPIKSILIASLLFGLVHLNPWQFITGFILGIFSGWVYYRTGSISFSIIIHATANLCGYLMRLIVNGNSNIDVTSKVIYGGFVNLTLVFVGSVIILTVCIFYLKKEFVRLKDR